MGVYRDEELDEGADGRIRGLSQIEEDDGRVPRLVTLGMVFVGGCALVFAALSLTGKKGNIASARPDPLAELVASSRLSASAARPTDLSTKDVTFPGMLSDRSSPSTALAAVRGEPSSREATIPMSPPPPSDRLPVVPLPAQHLVGQSQVVARSKDSLSRAASDVSSQPAPGSTTASEGRDGGYQLQVSSFRTMDEARRFADQLRARGHRAYAATANVPGRGTWYRVRIGPFSTQSAASAYRASFEQKEHMVAFLIAPTVR